MGRACDTEEGREMCGIFLVAEPKQIIPLGRPRHRRKYGFKICLTVIRWERENCIKLIQGKVADCCESDNKTLYWKIFDWLEDN
jgi:hypothetical protein